MDRIKESWRTLAICGLLGVIILGAYWPVLHNDFVQYDDPDYVTENVHTLSGLSWENTGWAFRTGFAANWHPLTWLSHMLDCQLYGLNPAGHHLTNLAFHLANAILLFLFFRLTTGTLWRSAFVAALFALHPLHVESVAWVAERKDVLSAFFFLLTLLAYAKYATRMEDRGWKPKKEQPQVSSLESQVSNAGHAPRSTLHASHWYALALLWLALGLMSKAMLVTTPFVLLLLDWWPLKRWEASRKNVECRSQQSTAALQPNRPSPFNIHHSSFKLLLEKVPFLALAAGSSLVTFLVQDQGHATAIGLPWESRVANAIVSYLKYLGKTLWPVDLVAFYPHPDIRYPLSNQWPLWAVALTTLLLATASVLAFRALKRAPWLAAGWFWYLGMLVPVIGLVQVGGQAMADRYTYLPLIGVFVGLAWGTTEWWENRRSRQWLVATAGVVAVAACSVLTHRQAGFWRNNSILWEHALAVNPNNPQALYNVGADLAKAGKYEPALAHLQAAVEANPTYAEAQAVLALTLAGVGRPAEALEACQQALHYRPWDATAHSSLAAVLWLQGKREAARQEYAEALRYKPGLGEAHYGLGVALLEENKAEESAQEFAEAVRNRPRSPEFRLGLGQALALAGRFPEAQAQLQEAVRLAPSNVVAQVTLGNALMETGHTNAAAACFATALRLDPALPETSLREARSLLANGQPMLALGRFTVTARLQPNNAEAHENLGLLYAQAGKLEAAVEQFQECLRLQPGAQAWYNLGLARVMQGNLGEAAAAYEQALKLNPDWPVALNDLAWIRATSAAADLRNGAEAVRLAQRACSLSQDKEPRYWGTLDAAYAEAGRFADAIGTAEKTRALALATGQSNIVEAAEQRLELYRKRQPYRQ